MIREMVGMVIAKRVSVTGHYTNSRLSVHAWGILLRVSCNFVADGAKTEPKAEDLLEVEPLVCRVEESRESLKSLPISGLSLRRDRQGSFLYERNWYWRKFRANALE